MVLVQDLQVDRLFLLGDGLSEGADEVEEVGVADAEGSGEVEEKGVIGVAADEAGVEEMGDVGEVEEFGVSKGACSFRVFLLQQQVKILTAIRTAPETIK